MNGHAFIQAFIELDDEIYPNMNPQYGLISRQYFRCSPNDPYVRHDLRIWEAAREAPRLKDSSGRILLGDDIVKDWRSRNKRGVARVRAYYDVHPAENSELTLDPAAKNKYGDPMPKIVHRPRRRDCRPATTRRKQHIQAIFERMAANDNGKILRTSEGNYLDHPAGGCRMGTDPAKSVCDNFGRTHDHENLFVVGAPTLPTRRLHQRDAHLRRVDAAVGARDRAVMGYALWLDEEQRVAWAQGTQEYRAIGAAAISITGQFRRADFRRAETCPIRLRSAFVGFFASLEEVNRFLGSRRKVAGRATPAYLR